MNQLCKSTKSVNVQIILKYHCVARHQWTRHWVDHVSFVLKHFSASLSVKSFCGCGTTHYMRDVCYGIHLMSSVDWSVRVCPEESILVWYLVICSGIWLIDSCREIVWYISAHFQGVWNKTIPETLWKAYNVQLCIDHFACWLPLLICSWNMVRHTQWQAYQFNEVNWRICKQNLLWLSCYV